jgi:hypothetical protein
MTAEYPQPDWFRQLQHDLNTPVDVPDGIVINWDQCRDHFLIPMLQRLETRTSSPHPAIVRPGHRMMEVWHPLGVVGVISAFNFPVAVWAWNFALALVCGDSVIWKPSEKVSKMWEGNFMPFIHNRLQKNRLPLLNCAAISGSTRVIPAPHSPTTRRFAGSVA